jgi:hypothetical protein
VIRTKNAWLSTMVVNPLNSWACYVADLVGTPPPVPSSHLICYAMI